MEVARYWRTTDQRYRLMGETDKQTGQKYFSARDGRNRPGNLEKTQFSGRGEVYSFTVIHAPPEGFGKYAPYIVALIRLAEGPLVTAQMTDVEQDEVRIGMPVEMVTRAIREDGPDGRGMVVYGYKFRPVWGMAQSGSGTQSVLARQPEPASTSNGKTHWVDSEKYPSDLAVVT